MRIGPASIPRPSAELSQITLPRSNVVAQARGPKEVGYGTQGADDAAETCHSVRLGPEHPSTLAGTSDLAGGGAPRSVRRGGIDEQVVAGAARKEPVAEHAGTFLSVYGPAQNLANRRHYEESVLCERAYRTVRGNEHRRLMRVANIFVNGYVARPGSDCLSSLDI
ncbi:hypothetical protein PMIN01_13519 [Paraphaeosphaeria minitans]|uniref:Uncharacterized protein n=1 Tax=Paraphaeosphaeria minitans TaxID=565426 RepID=A0A9P6G4B0_9PLEO|nr:hypothetical protein PMIN01_13519 [Paraphaeosphaeria minitans]